MKKIKKNFEQLYSVLNECENEISEFFLVTNWNFSNYFKGFLLLIVFIVIAIKWPTVFGKKNLQENDISKKILVRNLNGAEFAASDIFPEIEVLLCKKLWTTKFVEKKTEEMYSEIT